MELTGVVPFEEGGCAVWRQWEVLRVSTRVRSVWPQAQRAAARCGAAVPPPRTMQHLDGTLRPSLDLVPRGDVRACAEHCGLGPNGLEIKKETTHDLV